MGMGLARGCVGGVCGGGGEDASCRRTAEPLFYLHLTPLSRPASPSPTTTTIPATACVRSVLTALGVPELIAPSPKAYHALALKLAHDAGFYRRTREKLIAAATATRPRNPYWDLRRYGPMQRLSGPSIPFHLRTTIASTLTPRLDMIWPPSRPATSLLPR